MFRAIFPNGLCLLVGGRLLISSTPKTQLQGCSHVRNHNAQCCVIVHASLCKVEWFCLMIWQNDKVCNHLW